MKKSVCIYILLGFLLLWLQGCGTVMQGVTQIAGVNNGNEPVHVTSIGHSSTDSKSLENETSDSHPSILEVSVKHPSSPPISSLILCRILLDEKKPYKNRCLKLIEELEDSTH